MVYNNDTIIEISRMEGKNCYLEPCSHRFAKRYFPVPDTRQVILHRLSRQEALSLAQEGQLNAIDVERGHFVEKSNMN
jgi:hypothetical protein